MAQTTARFRRALPISGSAVRDIQFWIANGDGGASSGFGMARRHDAIWRAAAPTAPVVFPEPSTLWLLFVVGAHWLRLRALNPPRTSWR